MKSRPPFTLRLAFVSVAVILFFVCQERTGREVLRISITRDLTHLAVGQTSRLSAYEEYQDKNPDSVSAASTTANVLREPIAPEWSVSDPQIASINADGVLTALRPGSVVIESHWESFNSSTTIEVLKELPAGRLPQISVRGSRCVPRDADVSLAEDRAVRFRLRFNESVCGDVMIEGSAPQKPLPWTLSSGGARLELKSARGPIVGGTVSLPGGGKADFTLWSNGRGAYPVDLSGKTVLLLGDSMAEGLGWTMKTKVEQAGGRLVVIPWFSSTTAGWAGRGRFKEEIERYRPDVIFIALGSNEIFYSRSDESASFIRQMVSEAGERPAYWIGPPSWKPDHGIVRVIEDNFIPGRFYNSNKLTLPRRKDGAHPTEEGYAAWVELVWNWYARSV